MGVWGLPLKVPREDQGAFPLTPRLGKQHRAARREYDGLGNGWWSCVSDGAGPVWGWTQLKGRQEL